MGAAVTVAPNTWRQLRLMGGRICNGCGVLIPARRPHNAHGATLSRTYYCRPCVRANNAEAIRKHGKLPF